MEGRDDEPTVSKEIIVLEAIRNGITKFGRIQKTTRLPPEELNSILERLERQGGHNRKGEKRLAWHQDRAARHKVGGGQGRRGHT